MRFLPAAASVLLFATPRLLALQIEGYEAAINERFASGFEAGAPVANNSASFALAGYDLSGVGWQTTNNDFAVTLISDRHALTAAHVAPSVGASVSFLGTDGVVRGYTVASVTVLTFDGVASDVAFVKLSAAVDSARIKAYFGLGFSSSAAYAGLPVTLYGANGRVGTNHVQDVGAFDLLPFSTGPGVPSGNGVNDSVIAYTDFDATIGEAQAQGGDSGSPTFARMTNGDLAFVGVHSAIGSVGATSITIDSLPLLASQTQINNLLSADGYGPWLYYTSGVVTETIPEPAAAAALAGLSVAFAGVGRRRRRV